MVLSGKSGIFLSNIRNLLGSIALVSDRRRWKRKPQVEIIRQDKLRQEYINLSPAIKTSQQISKLSGNVAMNAIQSLDTDRNTLEKEEFQVDLQCKRKCNVPPRKEILQTPHIKVQQFKKQRGKNRWIADCWTDLWGAACSDAEPAEVIVCDQQEAAQASIKSTLAFLVMNYCSRQQVSSAVGSFVLGTSVLRGWSQMM